MEQEIQDWSASRKRGSKNPRRTFPKKKKQAPYNEHVVKQELKLKHGAINVEESSLTKKLFGGSFFKDFSDSDEDNKVEKEKTQDSETSSILKPVWQDDDETEEAPESRSSINPSDAISMKEYQKRRRERNQKSALIENIPAWATVKQASETNRLSPVDSDEEDIMDAFKEMTKSTSKYVAKSQLLPKTHLNFSKLKDITIGHHGNGNLKVMKFHPHRPVLMTASYHGKIALFEVCKSLDDITLKPEENFLQEVAFDKYIISSADYYNNGNSIFIGSTRLPYFFSYDLIDGKVVQIPRPKVLPNYNYGKFAISNSGELIAFIGSSAHVYVFTLKTMEHLHTFCAAANIVDVCFSPRDDHTIYASADNGTIYVWNLSMKGDHFTFTDEGCIHPTCLSVSPNEQFLAAGSNTGIVNIYDVNSTRQSQAPKPLYTISNLTTSASFLKFNHDSQALAFGSLEKKMSARLLQTRSGTVFQNFPAKQEMFERDQITCADFSPHSGFLAFGTEAGTTRIYRLNHFDKY